MQCDFAAMISPSMFAEFVVPALRRQCRWLDHSLFHLDGPSCICHIDHLLAIAELDAVQWAPSVSQPGAGNSKWFNLYEQILSAGEAKRTFDTFGSKGIYLSLNVTSEVEADDITSLVESMR